MPEPSCRTCRAGLPREANYCPTCGTPVHEVRESLTQTVPVAAVSAGATAARGHRVPWGAIAVLGAGLAAVVAVLILVRRAPPPVTIGPQDRLDRAESPVPAVPVATAPGAGVVLRMATQPPLPARVGHGFAPAPGGSGAAAGGQTGAAITEPVLQQTVRCRRAVKLKVDPDEATVEVDGTLIGTVDSLSHDTYVFESPGVHTLRIAFAGREAWVRAIVEAGADDTATVKVDLD